VSDLGLAGKRSLQQPGADLSQHDAFTVHREFASRVDVAKGNALVPVIDTTKAELTGGGKVVP
jgi:hypothetical protein